MLNFKNITPEERKYLLDDAEVFYFKNKEKINQMMYEIFNHIEPQGSILAHPKQWKAPHWNWFFSIRPINKKTLFEEFWDLF